MRVAVYHSNHDVRLEERPRPEPGPGELLLRVRASGLCGSDTMEWYRVPKAPLVLGHEVAGDVAAVGAGVREFAVGDRVVTTHHVPCNDCHYCRTDRHFVCETLHRTTFDPGGFSEFVRLPEINVRHGTFRLPDAVTYLQGSFVEPLACVLRGQRAMGLSRGDSVAVLGSGVSGILHVQAARAAGAATIVATDVNPTKRDAALRFGADAALPADADVAAVLRERTGGRLADRVVVCTGARPAFDQALQLVDRGGAVLFFAPLPPGERLPLDGNALWKSGVSLVHSYAGPPRDMATALAMIAAGTVDVSGMITHRLPLDETPAGFRLMADGGDCLKIVIEP